MGRRPCACAEGVAGRALEAAPSTIASVTRPLPAPPVAWLILKIAPPNVPFWVGVLCFLPFAAASRAPDGPSAAVVSDSVPWSASITVFFGICVSSVSGMNTPLTLISTTPLTSETLNVLPSVGEPGAGAWPS